MVKFKDIFPDYNSYINDEYLMNEVTESLLREIAQKFPNSMREYRRKVPAYSLDNNMITACNIVSMYTNNDNTINWGFDFIVRDFDSQMRDFIERKFHNFMDAMYELSKFCNFKDTLNDIFEEHDFGYRLTDDKEQPWISINRSIGISIDMDDLINKTSDICYQTAEHIRQAKQQLIRGQELRARKDAIRDCLSATEALMCFLTGTDDIVEADKILRSDTEKWGQGFIIKDGITLWNMFHNKYKDIRHGNNFNISNINHDEAIYFVDRLLAFVKFLIARAIKEDTRDN